MSTLGMITVAQRYEFLFFLHWLRLLLCGSHFECFPFFFDKLIIYGFMNVLYPSYSHVWSSVGSLTVSLSSLFRMWVWTPTLSPVPPSPPQVNSVRPSLWLSPCSTPPAGIAAMDGPFPLPTKVSSLQRNVPPPLTNIQVRKEPYCSRC